MNNTETIDITPTWETAVSIYIQVLKNPAASQHSVAVAEDELLRLARHCDRLITVNKNIKSKSD